VGAIDHRLTSSWIRQPRADDARGRWSPTAAPEAGRDAAYRFAPATLILADSSAWIDFLRATGSPAHRALAALVGGAELATTDVRRANRRMTTGARSGGPAAT
jgi:hypothetical protein